MNNMTFESANRSSAAGPLRSARQPARGPVTVAYAILLLVLGVLACAFPLLGSAFAGYSIAWTMIAGGLATMMAGIQHIREHSYWADLPLGLLTLAFGLAVLVFPLAGAMTILWSLSLWFAMAGVIKIGAAFRLRGGRWLQFCVGLLDLILSLVLLLEFAALDFAVVSALVGLSFILGGLAVLARSPTMPVSRWF